MLIFPSISKMTFADENIDPREKYNMSNFHKILENASWPCFNEDGDKITFIRKIDDSEKKPSIWIANIDGSNQTMLYLNQSIEFVFTGPKFSPDGNKILFCSYYNIDPENHTTESSIDVIIKNGTKWDNTSTRKQIFTQLGEYGKFKEPSWNPDGKKIVYRISGGSNEKGAGYGEIYVMNADGTDRKKLTDKREVMEWAPTWSPDGKKIAYLSTEKVKNYPKGYSKIWIMNASDGSNKKCLTPDKFTYHYPLFTPKNKILFTTDKQSLNNEKFDAGYIWMMNEDGTNPIVIVPANDSQALFEGRRNFFTRPTISPDCTKIIFKAFNNELFMVEDPDGDGEWEDSDGDGVANVCDGAPFDPNAGYVGALNRDNDSEMKNTYLGVLIATTIIVIGFVLLKIKYMDNKKKSRLKNPKIKDENRVKQEKK